MDYSNRKIECFREKHSVPKYLFQGSLFSATKSSELVYKERVFKTYEGKEVSVYSDGFTQFDLAVSLAYKKIINRHEDFNDINFTIAEFSNALNRKDGGKTRKYILEAFKKSNKFYLSFDFDENSFNGYRLTKFREVTNNKFKISFNMDYLSMVYADDDICEIDIDLFLSLKVGLQSWLYGFICSVPNLNKIDIDNLHELSGSKYKKLSDFKKAVKEALQALYIKKIISWRHGVTREGVVYWGYLNYLGKSND